MDSIYRHQETIQFNLQRWNSKPILRRIYYQFYARIADYLPADMSGPILELGSGVPDITEVIPDCIRTDLFPNPWIDQVENAYSLSLSDQTLTGIILLDVFHHLRYPGTALQEFHRALEPGGRVIIFDPGMSLLGKLVYGSLHSEPRGLRDSISWFAPSWWSPDKIDYYAAQGNTHRVFVHDEGDLVGTGWKLLVVKQFADISYIATGGYSKPQLYPNFAFPFMRFLDKVCNHFPELFTTRLLVVLERD